MLDENSLTLAKQGYELMDKKSEYPDPGADESDRRGENDTNQRLTLRLRRQYQALSRQI